MKRNTTQNEYDIVIVGSGIGGATLLNRLAETGARILLIERGQSLEDSCAARDSKAIFVDEKFRPDEQWLDGNGQCFNPGNYYYVGGNSKFYGAVMLRYREEDFGELAFEEGISPAWPFNYQELAPFYHQAETLYQVRGKEGQDCCEPSGAKGYIGEPVADEPSIARVRDKLAKAGAKPFSLPLALDIDRWMDRAKTPWDAFPDTGTGKMDAESAALNPVLDYPNVTLMTDACVRRFHTGADGKQIQSVELVHSGQVLRISAALFVLSAGAINSAAILLRSRNDKNPEGLANSSGQVGRNFMNHNCTALLALNPFRRNSAVYQKTLGINDFYLSDGSGGGPLGNIQLLGKIDGTMLKANLKAAPQFAMDWVARHSVDWYVMSEDLPNPDSRVMIDSSDRIVLDWRRSNMTAHRKLLKKAKRLMRAAGFPILLSQPFDRRTPSHQCGTVRIGNDPGSAPLDSYCRSYDHKNLFVMDASFLPTSAAVNPALTIAAQALRVAEHIKITELQ
ncbi:GMC oxidoreductase [Motiliproteus sp. MSK22-1]|uniref:GMC oxidoreductase n=1 Tax=Motiliproteus sp. MSK22-1 TaxID=1897630 RepID=UPI000976B46B|nr:GMC family oxidoreductase [Motiliproteus sp. MSK22-1]OMH29440.1 GMC family oxidoreductase [Motiliproteus sp. MSK22-1]